MFDEILQRGKFTERDAAVLMKQVLSCINYCHQNRIVHRYVLTPLTYFIQEKHKKIQLLEPEFFDLDHFYIAFHFDLLKVKTLCFGLEFYIN